MASPNKRVLFQVYFNVHADAPKVWTVKVGKRERRVEFVAFFGKNLWTRYRGPRARQPKAVIWGYGIVMFKGGIAVIL